MASSPTTLWPIEGEKVEAEIDFLFLGSKTIEDGDYSHEIRRCLLFGRKAMTNLDKCIKWQRHHFANKGPYSQSYGFSRSHVQMWVLDHKEGWVLNNWYSWSVVLEKTLESPLACKEIQAVSPKGNQPWIFIGRTDAEAEAPVLWPPDVKSWLLGKDPDAGKDWGQVEKETTEDEMVGWHHWFNRHEFEQILSGSRDRGGWCASAHGVEKTRLSDWTTVTLIKHKKKILDVWQHGDSLVLQWLGLGALTAEGAVSIPGRELRPHKLHSSVDKRKKKSHQTKNVSKDKNYF